MRTWRPGPWIYDPSRLRMPLPLLLSPSSPGSSLLLIIAHELERPCSISSPFPPMITNRRATVAS
eukprot:13461612-Heterocapsa_arctica.AAC.1